MSEPNTNPNAPEDSDGTAAAATAPAGDELSQAIRQRDEYLDQLQRTRAEFANYQKRTKSQAEADRGYLVGALALDVLSVLDNFERAIEAARAANAPGIVEGLDMVHRQMLTALAKHGIEPIAVVGEPFDPNHHEAVMQQPDASKPEGTVVGELARGYKLRDRVLRPAKVAVSVIPHAHPTS
jgi:molecular chaperone GrpE